MDKFLLGGRTRHQLLRLNRRMLAILSAVDPLDDYCDGLAFRTFRSMAEVKRARAKCDDAHGVAPLSPPAEDDE
jgi:hypothetical protein